MTIVDGKKLGNSNGGASDKVWEYVHKTALALILLAVPALINLHARVNVIEDSRFTNHDGQKLRNDIRDWIDTRYPPKWLQEKIEQIHTNQQQILLRINALEKRSE